MDMYRAWNDIIHIYIWKKKERKIRSMKWHIQNTDTTAECSVHLYNIVYYQDGNIKRTIDHFTIMLVSAWHAWMIKSMCTFFSLHLEQNEKVYQ